MTATAPSNSSKVFPLVVVGIIVLGVLAVAFVATRGSGVEVGDQTAAVEVDGNTIVPMPAGVSVTDPTNDPAAGTTAPTLVGTDFDGGEVTIEADGRPKAVYFLAHWCPHCQDEVPLVQELIDDGQVPDGLDLYAVSTAVDRGGANHPPQTWLDDEGFSPVTMRDDEAGSAFAAYGGSGFPYVVYLDADNRVVARSSGSLSSDSILALWDITVAAQVGADAG